MIVAPCDPAGGRGQASGVGALLHVAKPMISSAMTLPIAPYFSVFRESLNARVAVQS